jgi:hypothetical protein
MSKRSSHSFSNFGPCPLLWEVQTFHKFGCILLSFFHSYGTESAEPNGTSILTANAAFSSIVSGDYIYLQNYYIS